MKKIPAIVAYNLERYARRTTQRERDPEIRRPWANIGIDDLIGRFLLNLENIQSWQYSLYGSLSVSLSRCADMKSRDKA